MRKTVVVALASLVVVAVAAPAAQAEKATFSGTCAITGVSTFDPPLTGSHQITKYDFKSGAPAEGEQDATMCSGTLNGKPVENTPVTAAVAGEGDLSCTSGESTSPGKGSITFPDGSTFPFDFTFTAILTEVDFVAKYGNGLETTGHASFLHYAPPTAAADCEGAGIPALGFEATTDEGSSPAEGTRPDSGGSGGGDGSQPPTQTGSTPKGTDNDQPTTAQRRKACMKKAQKIKNKKKRKAAKRRCKKIK